MSKALSESWRAWLAGIAPGVCATFFLPYCASAVSVPSRFPRSFFDQPASTCAQDVPATQLQNAYSTRSRGINIANTVRGDGSRSLLNRDAEATT
jgi:hypothetical protein